MIYPIFWIVTNGVPRPHRRLGQCLHCGACCRVLWNGRRTTAEGRSAEDRGWDEWEGWSGHVGEDGSWYWWKFDTHNTDKPCAALEGNDCLHWGEESFPEVCQVWPVHPANLMPGCGFWFEEVEL